MGQIESTTQNEAVGLSKEKEEKETNGASSNGKESGSSGGKENKEMMHCVKNRIDMLIEGCLLSKTPNDLWVPDSRLKKSSTDVSKDIVNEEIVNNDSVVNVSENPKDADNGADLGDVDKVVMNGNLDGDVSGNKSDVSIKKEENDPCEKNDETKNEIKLCETDSDNKSALEKEVKVEVKAENSQDGTQLENVDSKVGNEKKEKLKVSDIISEMSKTDTLADFQKKKLTTFQTFIDQVLDNSLQHVNATMKVEKTTNILELCSKSMNPDSYKKVSENNGKTESLTKTDIVKTENSSGDRPISNNNETSAQNNKNQEKSDREKAIKSETHMISLKDHIERFLEISFMEKKPTAEESHSQSKQTDQTKEAANNSTHSKPGNSDNFNAQGLVNNMINQGLQINKLLSPSSGKPHKEKQNSPNVRLEPGEIARREYQQKPWPSDDRHSGQISKYSEVDRANMSRQYPNAPKLYGGQQQRSPNGGNPAFHEMEQQRGYLVRPKVEYPDYKGQIYGGEDRTEHRRDEHILSHERYPGYQLQKLQKPIPHMMPPDPSDSALHQAMMYTPQYSPRHPHLNNNEKDHSLSMHQESVNNRGHKQPIHPRDCKCAMCASHPDSRFQAREHKSPDHHSSKLALSPSAFPQYSPHAIHPAYLSFQTFQSQPDQPPAMMRSSHSAVPPGYVGFQQMPKLLPHHPPITSPKEYRQMQLNVPQNIPSSKTVHPSHRLSTEDNLSAEMYAYRQSRLDPSNTYQKRMKEHEISQGKYGGYPVASPRRPSSATRDDQRKEVHDILQSPEPRGPGGDWSRRRDCPSNSSSVSGEIPLDLSFKKSDIEKNRRPSFSNLSSGDIHQFDSHRPRTQSFIDDPHMSSEGLRVEPHRQRAQTMGSVSQPSGGNVQRKGNSLFNTFIKHLESSVDKYCNELKASPPPGNAVTSPTPPSNKSGSPSEPTSGPLHGYRGQSSPSNGPQLPASNYGTLSPCAPYTGGITLGQPILGPEARTLHLDNRQSPKQTSLTASSSVPSQAPTSVMQPVTTAATVNYGSIDQGAKRNNISKHEPIQNIIGSHDPNDILYLICRLCAQTYGSPYGFRKHFRNQHGFEPRAEHTIVQTISATKTALHGPNIVVPKGEGEVNIENSGPHINEIKLNQEISDGMDANTHVINESPSFIKSTSNSSQDSNSICSEEDQDGDKSKSVQNNSKETKCLECPECGKTFQLNDFGSYKRHCRQHGQVKMNGTLTCSKCHLSFADQQLLKEHYTVHVKDNSHTQAKNEKPVSKTEITGNVYSCVPCEKTFDDMSAYQEHVKVNHKNNDGPPKLSPQISLPVSESGDNSVTSKEEVYERKWPDISLSVIPSHNIVKQAAESMTALACPDSSSSWNDSGKNIPGSSGDKMDETNSENYDSASIGSNSNLNADEKLQEPKSKISGKDYLSQKSLDSNQDNLDDKTSDDGCEFQYKHKKFSSHRKRAFSNCSQSSDSTPAKQSKLSPPVLSRSDTPVTSCSVLISNETADSTCSVDSKGEDSPSVKDILLEGSPMDDLKVASLDGSFKQEARHHLPFVWDRVTRSQVGRKTK